MVGIYKITNTENGKCYIGQSININDRITKHKNKYKNKKDHSFKSLLYQDLRSYGIEEFKFEIIEECKKNQLDEREIYWINYFNSFFNGYNESFGGQSHLKMDKETFIGIVNDLETTDITQKEIAVKWNISEEMIQGINTGRYIKHNRIYPIRKRNFNKNSNKKVCIDCGKRISNQANRCVECDVKRKTKKPVRSELEALLKQKNFKEIAKEFQLSDTAIRKWCKSYNLPYTQNDLKKFKSY